MVMRSRSHLEKQENVELRQVRKEKSWQNEEKYLGTLNAVSCLKIVDLAGGCLQRVAGKAAWRDRLRTGTALVEVPESCLGWLCHVVSEVLLSIEPLTPFRPLLLVPSWVFNAFYDT